MPAVPSDARPPLRRSRVLQRDRITRRRTRNGTHRVRQPAEEVAKTKTLKAERVAHADLLENVHVRALDTDREELEILSCLALAQQLRRAVPFVGRGTIGDQEDPRAVVGDAI